MTPGDEVYPAGFDAPDELAMLDETTEPTLFVVRLYPGGFDAPEELLMPDDVVEVLMAFGVEV